MKRHAQTFRRRDDHVRSAPVSGAAMKSARQQARQNLLVATVNAALKQKLITLQCEPVTSAVFEFTLAGYPVIAAVSDAGFDEVAIKAIVGPTAMGRKFVRCSVRYEFRRHGEAATFAWLERRDGKYLQSGVNYHGTKAVTERLSRLSVAPRGFDTVPTASGYDWFRECERVFGPHCR